MIDSLCHICIRNTSILISTFSIHQTLAVLEPKFQNRSVRQKPRVLPCVGSRNRLCIKPSPSHRKRSSTLLTCHFTFFSQLVPQTPEHLPEMEKSALTLHEMAVSSSQSQSIDCESSDTTSGMSRDATNPRNWTSARKTMLFVSLMTSSLLADGYV